MLNMCCTMCVIYFMYFFMIASCVLCIPACFIYFMYCCIHIAACIVFIHRYVEEHIQSTTDTVIHTAVQAAIHSTQAILILYQNTFTPKILKWSCIPLKKRKKIPKSKI